MRSFKQRLSLILALIMLLATATGFVGCATGDSDPSDSNASTTSLDAETGEVDHRFDGVNFGGRAFRVYTSIDIASAGMGNSNFLIEGDPEEVGNMVNDAVIERNVKVEEMLGVTLEYIPCDVAQMSVAGEMRKFVQSGDDEFDLVINDMYGFSSLLVEGSFRNVLDEDCVFDFDRPYWYKDFMEDLSLVKGYQYLLAGDYTIDVLRSAHLLLLNKEIYRDYYNRSADEIYDMVMNHEWTYEKMNEIITDKYVDTNLNNVVDMGDQFGFINAGSWGYFVPFIVCGNPPFTMRHEDGTPELTLHEGDRSAQVASAMSLIINNDSTTLKGGDGQFLTRFTQNECLIVGYQRMGSLENPILRQMEGDAAVLPYPLLFSSDKKYVTSAHDTSEVGAILTTSKDLGFISTVTEVLCRETANIVMPKYYKESLQVQCVDDPKAAAMIDIIHDNFDNSFILAYENILGNNLFDAFFTAAKGKREFSAVFAGRKRSSAKLLTSVLTKYRRYNNLE